MSLSTTKTWIPEESIDVESSQQLKPLSRYILGKMSQVCMTPGITPK